MIGRTAISPTTSLWLLIYAAVTFRSRDVTFLDDVIVVHPDGRGHISHELFAQNVFSRPKYKLLLLYGLVPELRNRRTVSTNEILRVL